MAAFVNVPFVDTLEIPLIPKYFHFVGNFKTGRAGKSNYITYQVLLLSLGFIYGQVLLFRLPIPKIVTWTVIASSQREKRDKDSGT